MAEIKRIEVGENLLAENDAIAAENAALLHGKGIISVNLMGSAGSGKTRILEKTIPAVQKEYPCAVIEGDIAGMFDSERLKRFGVPVVQINTGGACHLEAHMIQQALAQVPLDEIRLLFVENVGNLVCPAEFTLGIDRNIVVASVTDGEEKAAKYPLMYSISDLCLLNKTDLLGVLRFDVERFKRHVAEANPQLRVLPFSAETGAGLPEWIAYLTGRGSGLHI